MLTYSFFFYNINIIDNQLKCLELIKTDKRYKGYVDDESGKKVSGAGSLYSKIARLPLQKRLELLPDWLEYGQEALNEEEPHLEHTILPPNDRSETNEELPQLKQTLFALI